jgi:hypothetical protein
MPKLDTGLLGKASMDVYILAEYMGRTIRTKVVKATTDEMIAPIVQELWFPI